MSTVCRNCRVRVQRLQDGWNNTPSSSGSRRRAPGILRSQRGVTQSIPIDGLVATPWSAVDRGNCKSDPEAKIAAPARKSHHTLICRKAAGVGGVMASAIFLYSENSRGLKP